MSVVAGEVSRGDIPEEEGGIAGTKQGLGVVGGKLKTFVAGVEILGFVYIGEVKRGMYSIVQIIHGDRVAPLRGAKEKFLIII